MDLAKAILLLGSNLGDRKAFMQKAISEIEKLAGQIVKQSSIYETEPWGTESKNGYLNQAICVETDLSPLDLLNSLQKIEIEIGRTRNIRWEDRVIDIDILLYENEIIDTPTLTIPHTEIQNRRFALIPVSEIAGNWIHPVFQVSLQQLLEKCMDKSEVKRIQIA